MLEKVSDGAKLHVFERFVQRALRLSELAIARAQLFETLDVGGELIGGFDEAVLVRMLVCLQIGIELFFELGRQSVCDLFDGELFELFVFAVDAVVEVFDGGGQIARHHLAHFVIEGVKDGLLRVDMPAEDAVFDADEGVRQDCDRVRMLHDVLVAHRAHELPALDELHAV